MRPAITKSLLLLLCCWAQVAVVYAAPASDIVVDDNPATSGAALQLLQGMVEFPNGMEEYAAATEAKYRPCDDNLQTAAAIFAPALPARAAPMARPVVEQSHQQRRVQLIYYRMATAYYRAGLAGDTPQLWKAVEHYADFAALNQDHELADDAIYWAANALRKLNQKAAAFTFLSYLLQRYPNSDMRGYLGRHNDIKEEHPGMEAETN